MESKQFFLGIKSEQETDIILFPDPKTVFETRDLYLSEDYDNENSEEESYFLNLVPTIKVPLNILNPDYKSFAYFLYQEEVDIDGLYYTINKNGKIETCKAFKYENHKMEFGINDTIVHYYFKYRYGFEDLISIKDFEEEKELTFGKAGYIALNKFSYDKPLTNFSPQYDENGVYNEDYYFWQEEFFKNFTFPKREYDNPGIINLGLYPLWIQNGWFFPKDSNGKTMQFVGSSNYFALNLNPIYPFLFFSSDTYEFVQINQMT